MSSKNKADYWLVEGRWEHSHDSPNAASYFRIDEIGGSLEDAQTAAQEYHNRRSGRAYKKLEWAAGSFDGRIAYYANSPTLTIRITN